MEQKLAIVMVGLPARGKTYVAGKLERYLSWSGVHTRLFNVGAYRRERLGSRQSAEFFSPDNVEGREARLGLAMTTLDDMFDWLRESGSVAIYDATNTTLKRRQLVRERCEQEDVRTLFVEIICEDEAVIERNIRETKLDNADYLGVDADQALDDFRARIAYYQSVYEPVLDDDLAHIKLVDMGRQLILNRVAGPIPTRVARFLMSLSSVPATLWLTRHGESEFNERGLLGGDPELTSRGRAYAYALAEHVRAAEATMDRMTVWSSTLRRTLQTAGPLDRDVVRWRQLDEINAGVCEGMTYKQVHADMPEEFAARAQDKFHYRYPRGESYEEVIQRLDPVVLSLEKQRTPLLIIGHQAVLRALYSYVMGTPAEQCPHLDIPLHTLIKLSPRVHQRAEIRVPLPVE